LYGTIAAVVLGCFVADLILPRGATPAIGYSLVPLLAVRTRRPRFILWAMGLCTLLTWVGYWLEPSGAPTWMSVFERSMVTGVLWLTVAICRHRMRVVMELERVSRELARSNAELEVFASAAAHDLRSPLSAISLFAGLLSRRSTGQLDPEWAECLLSIRSEVERMSTLIDNLLSCGRAGEGGLHAMACDCESILFAVLRDLGALLNETGGQVTHDALPVVSADPVQMSRVLQNLIENAIKYRGERPPHVHVAARREAEAWVFSVQDNGIGIGAADVERIFGWFERGRTDRAGPEGAGIGLATCKRIIERHGGRIWVESRPGAGSTFRFSLPTVVSPTMVVNRPSPVLSR
jgi:signal transduction histidine kinase